MSKPVNMHNRTAKYLVSCINILININSIKHKKNFFMILNLYIVHQFVTPFISHFLL